MGREWVANYSIERQHDDGDRVRDRLHVAAGQVTAFALVGGFDEGIDSLVRRSIYGMSHACQSPMTAGRSIYLMLYGG